MFKIGEFSKLVRVSARMLRYYEQNGLLKPAETDRFTGYRGYSAAQIPLLRKIARLRDAGFGVDEIKGIIPRFDDADFMRGALERKGREVEASIADEQAKLRQIAALRGKLDKEEVFMVYEVELKALKAESVVSLRETIPSAEDEPKLWERLYAFARENGARLGEGGYSIYHDEDYRETDADVEIAAPVAALGADKDGFIFKRLDAIPQAATVRFSGSYDGFAEAAEKLAAWVEGNGYVFDGQMRGCGIVMPNGDNKPEDWLTELQAPVRKA